MKVYVRWYQEYDVVIVDGVYSSKAKAEADIPDEYKDSPEGYEYYGYAIEEFILNQ
ncbi:hypothetical protein [Pediococcus stilesii]|uniref:hypothetical protein n=1 Tax=Pediococcus stilesii TaxID=331679 RepID=UPI0014871C55|nr:hypothetical protein [Pediococcus stilesii]